MAPTRSRLPGTVLIAALIAVLALAVSVLVPPSTATAAPIPPLRPPAGGYFQLRPVGSFATLPNDQQAAAAVHRSTWEPRPQNAGPNGTVAPASFHVSGYSGETHRAQVFGRITGNFTGTTDEIIQWAAAKWGLPDDVVRAEAVVESDWSQATKGPDGKPVRNKGYGDFGDCGGSPAPSGYGSSGPSSFGLLQTKWCSMTDRQQKKRAASTGQDFGGWPWTERSTAYAVDFYAGVVRGCYEGWDSWLGRGYRAGDLWGCVGRWFSGGWHDQPAEQYIAKVRKQFAAKPWERW